MQINTWFRSIITLCVLSGCCAAAVAEVYQWTDADGRVHFGDRPPPGARPVPMAPPQAAPAPGSEQRLASQNKLLNALEAERQQHRAAQHQAQQEKAERERGCREARERLQAGIRSTAMYMENEAGERVYLDEAAREQSIERFRREVEAWCGKS